MIQHDTLSFKVDFLHKMKYITQQLSHELCWLVSFIKKKNRKYSK